MAIRATGNPVDNTLASDLKSVQDLRAQFKTDRQAGVKAAAQEFEALFLQMVMKTMRETTGQDSLMDSETSRFFTTMLDEQMAKELSRTGRLGLAKMIETQLGGQFAASGKAASISGGAANVLPPSLSGGQDFESAMERLHSALLVDRAIRQNPALRREEAAPVRNMAESADEGGGTFASPRDFVEKLWPHAVEASRGTGVPPQFLIAHAALESGWGKRGIPREDGSPSYNLFGIKAGSNWQGGRTETLTTEYIDGAAVRQKESFRAYASYAESFADYASLLRDSPRYGNVIGSQNGTEFARRLQQAGYATDPQYAEKLAAIINGPTLRQALIG